MISMVVPTRNRAHTLRLVAGSYLAQRGVDQVIFVSDGSTDDTADFIATLAHENPGKEVKLLRSPERKGAAHSRNMGVAESRNEYILFCDDDEYLEADYAITLMNKLQQLDAGAISGRRIYLQGNETPVQALRRFGNGMRSGRAFHPSICEYVNGARFSGDISLPLTNANILTRRSLVLRFPFDDAYRDGNGYREESDFQMNLFVNGYRIYMSNDCHSFHLPLSHVRSGGQRTSALKRVYWSIRHTSHFFKKYYDRYSRKMRLRTPRSIALGLFAIFVLYRELLRPPIHSAMTTLIAWQRRTRVLNGDAS